MMETRSMIMGCGHSDLVSVPRTDPVAGAMAGYCRQCVSAAIIARDTRTAP